ncbi:hypothetical protein ISCGN_001957 [Ixodes scapularis]
MCPYKLGLIHGLSPGDYEMRHYFCRDELLRIEQDPSHVQFLLFSDEATFHLDRQVNTQNCRYWSSTNLHWTLERALQSPKVTVCCGIWREGVVGPFFFGDNVSGGTYLQMMQDEFLPEFEALHMQQDVFIFNARWGATPLGDKCKALVDSIFPGCWMGRGPPNMPWLPRLPGLTVCDFSVWGFVES